LKPTSEPAPAGQAGPSACREVTEENRPTALTVPRGRGKAAESAGVNDVVFTNPVSIKKILDDQLFSINLLNKLVQQILFFGCRTIAP
jgi:hypothetical protein